MDRTTTLNSSELINLIAGNISRLADWRDGFTDILEYLNVRLASGGGFIRLYNYLAGNYFDSVAQKGLSSNSVIDAIFDQLLEDKVPIAIPFEYANYLAGEQQHSIIGVPILKNNEYLGAIVLSGSDRIGIRESQYRELVAFSPYLLPLFESAALQEILLTSYLDTIETLAMALEAKDKYTRGHSNMVCAYATSIARKMGFDGRRLQAIEIGSMMHDIGKIGVPDSILLKPGPLTAEEFEIIKLHPLIGEDILEPMQHPMFDMPRRIVRWHHEQINGRGYPDGLVDDEIPIEARITFVADAYEAMTSDRPYRKGLAPDAAFSELRKNSGTQFDSNVIDVFYDLISPMVDNVKPVMRKIGLDEGEWEREK